MEGGRKSRRREVDGLVGGRVVGRLEVPHISLRGFSLGKVIFFKTSNG